MTDEDRPRIERDYFSTRVVVGDRVVLELIGFLTPLQEVMLGMELLLARSRPPAPAEGNTGKNA